MSSQSWYSCGFFCLLWLVGASVLSNLVYIGPFHPKPTQDYKVSICITIMCMRNSCWCTYCLQEGLMGMKVFSLIFFALMHMAKIHVTHCLLYHGYALTCFYIQYSHDCIHVGGAYACYMSFQSFTYYSQYLYLRLWCMLSSITKKGEIESTSASWVILVINVNISLVGLILLPSLFQIKFNNGVTWSKGCGTPSRHEGQRIGSSSKHKTLHFTFSDPRSHWVHRKANTIKRGWGVA